MTKILISYRRSDTAGVTGRLFDRLVAKYGQQSVFMDVDNIPFGIDFRDHIKTALIESDVLLAIVGTSWLGPHGNGKQRIKSDDDPVRVEIEAALKAEIPLIPVLVDQARMPSAADLPTTIQAFAYRNAATVDQGRDFSFHVDRLIRAIDNILEAKAKRGLDQSSEVAASRPAITVNQPANEPPVNPERPAVAKSPAPSASDAGKQVLSVQNLEAWYGESHILHGINFDVNAGEVVTLLGRNGAGKTTTLKSVMGIIGKRTGAIHFDGQDIIRASSDKIARMGIAFCPEERGIFASLDVRENLLLPPVVRSGGLSLDQIFELFPNLKERLNSQGTKLSGGEQQMLAIGRILRTGARFLMLDEPTEGLAPVIIQQIGHTIARLKKEGFTILLVEQNFRFAATVADRYYIVEHGKIIDGFANAELQSNMGKLHTYLGV